YRRLKNASISEQNTAVRAAMISEDFIAGIAHEVISILFDAEADSLSSPSLQANLRSGQHAGKYS
ncbi:hypothetical protein, partial [Pseudomonas viridiflava]|uniref:hypothetical protein n=1 Tax=Pseudomonas viridiflava TaxID=33069 RepID=UPI0019D20EBE